MMLDTQATVSCGRRQFSTTIATRGSSMAVVMASTGNNYVNSSHDVTSIGGAPRAVSTVVSGTYAVTHREKQNNACARRIPEHREAA
ncbi:MAG: hypothetical protein ACSLE1_03595 [Sphingobium sp.]